MDYIPSILWHNIESIVTIGFQRSRVVMMNEAHHGDLRCIRTRVAGQRAIQFAHKVGVRHLAMETLSPDTSELLDEVNCTKQLPRQNIQRLGYYLKQLDMQVMVQTALDLSWTLVPYEADLTRKPAAIAQKDNMDDAVTNWREEQQARNLITALQRLSDETKLLVWCGNNHHLKIVVPPSPADTNGMEWVPMGYQFQQISGINPFIIDQTPSIRFPGQPSNSWIENQLPLFEETLREYGGTAGVLFDELSPVLNVHKGNDAYIISLQNEME